MAWSHIQSATNGADGASSIAKAFTTANLTDGTKILAAVSAFAASTTSVHDGASNALVSMGAATVGNCHLSLWAMDTPAGDVGIKPTITASAPGAGAIGIVIQEIGGLLAGNTTAILDGTAAAATGTSSTPATPAYASAAAGEYLVSVYGDPETNTTTWTPPGSPWATDPGQNGTFITSVGISYKDSTGGTESDGYTINNSESWAILMVAFQLASTNPTSGPNYAGSGSSGAGGSGSWSNPGNAGGSPDASYATWTAP